MDVSFIFVNENLTCKICRLENDIFIEPAKKNFLCISGINVTPKLTFYFEHGYILRFEVCYYGVFEDIYLSCEGKSYVLQAYKIKFLLTTQNIINRCLSKM